MLEVAEKFPGNFLRYQRGLIAMQLLYSKKRAHAMEVKVYWGQPGTGKSRDIHATYPNAYWKDSNNRWWDNYQGEKEIVLDDFIGKLDQDFFLRLLDRYPLLVECKGGSYNFQAQTILISTMVDPMEWYNLTPASIAWRAIRRRVTEWVYYSERGVSQTFGLDYDACKAAYMAEN